MSCEDTLLKDILWVAFEAIKHEEFNTSRVHYNIILNIQGPVVFKS